MIKRFYITVIFVTVAHLGFAATGHLTQDTVKNKFIKLYILEFYDKPPIMTKYAFFDPMMIDSSSTISNSSNAEIGKLLKVDFVLVVKLMPHTKLLSFNEFLDLYKIQMHDRNLPVIIDDKIIDYPETILISENQIEKVAVEKGTNGFYINVTLMGFEEIKKERKKG